MEFIYIRLHGSTELYNSRYTDSNWIAGPASSPPGGRGKSPPDLPHVYCYFDNTDKRHAPENARELMRLLGERWEPS